MPPKKKAPAKPASKSVPDGVTGTVFDTPAAPKTREVPVCGHVNRHSFSVAGKPDNITCDLLRGHAGDHSAMHAEKQYGEVVDVRTFWGDMAGTPAKEITPDSLPPATPRVMPP